MKTSLLLATAGFCLLAACVTDNDDDARIKAQTTPVAGVAGQRRDLDEAMDSNEPRTDPHAVPAEPAPPADKKASQLAVIAKEEERPAEAGLALRDRPGATAYRQGFVASPVIRRPSEPLYRERYVHPRDQGVMRVASDPVSTFSIDVDTGSYTNTRRWLNQGRLPPEDAVRVEEFINYFDYAYPAPRSRRVPFQVSTEIAPTPWNRNTLLLSIGIQGYRVPKTHLPASNLVFLIDVSGSMRSDDKLPLLQRALSVLADRLDARDCISIVVYAGASGVVLPPTSGSDRAAILAALNRLQAGGSTNGAAGIRLAYRLAQQQYIANGVNRVILATDGDFNVGVASTEELVDLVQRKRKAGIALTTLGFGSGNYNDHLLERLADEGNGNHAYIDRLSEARKVLGEELSATLMTIAKDVKIQIEFNPARVAEYRLIGYANRVLREEDFNNDKVDAGEIGAGHRVTALYEISLAGSAGQRLPPRRYAARAGYDRPETDPRGGELAELRIRYKLPGEDTSRLLSSPVLGGGINKRGGNAFNFAAAVAAFGQKLRGGRYLGSFSYADIAGLAYRSRGSDPHGYRGEFVRLVNLAQALDGSSDIAQRLIED